jgi:thioredoxin reductase (NADPH)
MSQQNTMDCLIIGGGPAGLTAAIYLARYRRDVLVIDAGQSRARLIPETHNYPGFAEGVAGPDLLAKLREQAVRYGARLQNGTVELLQAGDGTFTAHVGGSLLRACRVLLATGMVDESPDVPRLRDAIYRGALRYCPICDGYEATDKRIGVLGRAHSALKKAIFLRTYSRNVTLLVTDDRISLSDKEAKELAAAGILMPDERVVDVERTDATVRVIFASGKSVELAVLYPSLGCDVRSDLATALGAKCDQIGCLRVDDKQRTTVEGLYAAGDVVTDLHQISVATGHASIAATSIHNSLEKKFR